jgi:two-component sensor histidine kinase
MSMPSGILLVGNPESLTSPLDILKTAGYSVRTSAAVDALGMLREQSAEIVVLDAQGGEHSWRLCGELQSDPELASIPVILLGSETTLLERVAAQSELQRLRDAVAEHRVLMQETHHRVKNNLQWVNSVLFLQAAQLKQREVAAILEATQGRVRSMALIHDALYRSESLASLSFREYLEQLCENLWEAFEPRSQDMELELNCPDLQLGVDRTATCGLLVNELVTNAFKHGYPENGHGRVAVTFEQKSDTYVLSVYDDGLSPPAGDMPESDGTMGLQLIRLLTAKLRGKFSMVDGGGWGVRVEFPQREPGAVRG